MGEIASDNVISTLPDSALQKMADPANILKLWDRILSAASELTGLPAPLVRPKRRVVDEQIGAGYMHAGYPIMITHSPAEGMSSLDILTHPEKLLRPGEGGAGWGSFHKIGHNHQNLEWAFEGSTEVSCNILTLYIFDRVLKTRKGDILT